MMEYTTKNIDVIIAICLGFFWLIFIDTIGLKFSPDSMDYMIYAMEMHYAVDFSSSPLLPPVYPFLINLFMFFNPFPAEAAALLSGISILLFFIIFTLILKRFSQNVFLNSLFLLTLFTFIGLSPISLLVSSEVAFSLFLVLNFYFVIKHYETKSLKYYLLAAIFVSLAALTRYIGYSLIATFFVYTIYFLIIQNQEKSGSKNHLWHKYLFLNSLTYIPSLLYLGNNYMISHTFHGQRYPSNLTIFENVLSTFKVFKSDISFFLWLLLTISIVLYFFLMMAKKYLLAKQHTSLVLSYILFFILTYTTIVVYTASQVKIDPIQSRYFSPIYSYFFLFIFISFKNTLHLLKMERANKYFYNSLQIVLYSLVLATFLTYAKDYTQSIKNIFQKQHTAAYYSEAGFKLSTTSKKFNSYFKNRFTQHDQLYVSVIDRYRYNAVGAFFFRESIINDPIFKHLSFENVKPHEGDVWSPDFTISFSLNHKKKSLIYRNLYRPIDAKQLIKTIRHLFKEETNSFLLIVDKGWKGKDFLPFSSKNIKITFEKSIEPYRIYKVMR